MSNDSNHMTRRRLVAVFGSSAVFSVAMKRLLPAAAQQKTTAPSPTPATPSDAIATLIQDHRAITTLMTQIAQTSNPTQRTQLLQQLANLLTLHNSSEENLIYPAIRDIANEQSDAQTLYQQQDTAKVLLFELDQLSKSDPNWGTRFATFRSGVLAHISQEETRDFPRLRQIAGTTKLNQITAEFNQLRSHWHF